MMLREQSKDIKILLFISGFSILALEILGIRILASYVGSTVPVWAAVVGIPLVGSVIGYYWGGVLADRVQKKEVLLYLAIVASAYIALIPSLRGLMNGIAPNVSYGVGAIIGATLLFLPPVALLSALTVYVIRIFVKNIDSLGRVHGDLYALTTIGSVVAVFGTSYLLVPHFTVPHILYVLAATIIVCSLHVYLIPHSEESRTSAN